jgi:hypothetical protein
LFPEKLIPPVLVVLDAATGDSLNSMPIDTSVVKGGTFAVNDIAITPSGKILGWQPCYQYPHFILLKYICWKKMVKAVMMQPVLLEWSQD